VSLVACGPQVVPRGRVASETTSSLSRTRKGKGRYLLICLCLLVRPLVLVGLRELWSVLNTRSTPHPPPKIARSHSSVRASRRAGTARPGHARLVQVERPTGRTTWTRRAWSGCLRCAAGSPRAEVGIPERPGPGREALAAGGGVRVGGPEALPAGGRIVRRPARPAKRGRSRSPPPPWRPQVIGRTSSHPRTLIIPQCHDRCRRRRERPDHRRRRATCAHGSTRR
jgi:hypothetical protein